MIAWLVLWLTFSVVVLGWVMVTPPAATEPPVGNVCASADGAPSSKAATSAAAPDRESTNGAQARRQKCRQLDPRIDAAKLVRASRTLFDFPQINRPSRPV